MARPLKAQSGDTRQEIIDAAARLFAEHGYHGTSLQRICEVVGVTRRALLHHFESKEGLFEAVLRARFLDKSGKLMEESISSAGAADEVFTHLWLMVDHLLQQERGLVVVAFAQMMQPDGAARSLVRDVVIPYIDRFEAYLRETSDPPIPPDAPVREALMQLAVSLVARTGMGDFGDDIWGSPADMLALSRAILLDLQEWPRKRRARQAGSSRPY